MNAKRPQSEETRQKFIDTAFELFKRKGYGETTMNAIATESGFTRSNLYLYFSNKTEIVHARMLDIEPRLFRPYAELFEVSEHNPETVRAWLDSVRELWERQSVTMDAIQQALTVSDELSAEWLAMLHRFARQLPGVAGDQGRTQDFIALAMSLDRNFFFLILRNNRKREELVMQSLTRQWLTMFRD